MIDWIAQGKYPKIAVVNFIVLVFWGISLRYMQLYDLPWANYLFLLHAHSHFAFAGWMFFSLALLITHSISGKTYSSAYKNVFVFTLISAFGMLISFSLQGYKPISIAFSTLFVLVTYGFTYLVFKARKLKEK